MKRYIAVFIFLFLAAAFLPAKEYSYLTPPTISVMDFEVNIEEPLVEGNEGVAVDKSYYGRLVNHTLVTVLIKKNNDYTMLIPRDPLTGYTPQIPGDPNDGLKKKDSPYGIFARRDARYFPQVLKIYDKKYVENALSENNYTVEDLYNKTPDAFNFPELDFVVLGNVFDYGNNQLAINARVLNTYRGEELFSYTQIVQKDMTDLYLSCDLIARGIISDILKNYCSQFIVKDYEPEEVGGTAGEDNKKSRPSKPAAGNWDLFCQSRQEKDNTANIITYNDTYKKRIEHDQYYWMLPGAYVVTVYNAQNQSVHEINFTLQPREIKLIQLKEEHFETETGSVTIQNIPPTVLYQIEIVEDADRDAKYIWEIGDARLKRLEKQWTARLFDKGRAKEEGLKKVEDVSEKNEIGDALWEYNAAANELVVSNLPITKFKVRMKADPTLGEDYINGILRINTNGVKTSEPITADLRSERDAVLDFTDFDMIQERIADEYKRLRITFLVNPAFEDEWTLFRFYDGHRADSFWFRNFEKVIVETTYTEEEWDSFVFLDFELSPEGGGSFYDFYSKEWLMEERDYIEVVDFSSGEITRPKEAEKKGFLQRLFGK
jgi:hypothetical protein